MTHSPRKVLIVEDDRLIAFMMADMVQSMGCLVVGPYHVLQDGLDHARRGEVDFALLDYDLGDGTDSLPIAETLNTRGIPFAFATGTDPSILREITNQPILSKPVVERELATLIH